MPADVDGSIAAGNQADECARLDRQCLAGRDTQQRDLAQPIVAGRQHDLFLAVAGLDAGEHRHARAQAGPRPSPDQPARAVRCADGSALQVVRKDQQFLSRREPQGLRDGGRHQERDRRRRHAALPGLQLLACLVQAHGSAAAGPEPLAVLTKGGIDQRLQHLQIVLAEANGRSRWVSPIHSRFRPA